MQISKKILLEAADAFFPSKTCLNVVSALDSLTRISTPFSPLEDPQRVNNILPKHLAGAAEARRRLEDWTNPLYTGGGRMCRELLRTCLALLLEPLSPG